MQLTGKESSDVFPRVSVCWQAPVELKIQWQNSWFGYHVFAYIAKNPTSHHKMVHMHLQWFHNSSRIMFLCAFSYAVPSGHMAPSSLQLQQVLSHTDGSRTSFVCSFMVHELPCQCPAGFRLPSFDICSCLCVAVFSHSFLYFLKTSAGSEWHIADGNVAFLFHFHVFALRVYRVTLNHHLNINGASLSEILLSVYWFIPLL